ncbi:DM13 domain-containing protein [Marinoscillum sp.]|uniref:DM13 domain-containing protein n=1 Tax=Marinoscillum sp. TaxID=2024838 RepID=UPI003BAB6123
MKNSIICIISILATSCIGTDYLDDPKDPAILTNVTSASLEIGGTFQVEATYYYNMWVADESAVLFWRSNNPDVATVDQNGLVTGTGKGQTQIVIIYPEEDTVRVGITVVTDFNDVAEVLIASSTSSIDVGGTTQLSLEVYNLAGDPYAGTGDTLWSVSDASVASITQEGLLTGLSDGQVNVTASVDGVLSEPLPIMVGMQARTGTFQGVGSYQAIGTCILEVADNDDLTLTFSDNFTTSFALGTFVYLANTTDGAAVRAQGVELGEITSNGAKFFNVSEIDASIELDDYRYVIILCKPASITFGYADLN